MNVRISEIGRRLRNDFQLSIITLLGILGAAGILPFAIYRFVVGDTFVGIVDSSAVVGILGAIVVAWKTGRLDLVGGFLAVLTTSVSVTVAVLFGVFGLFWVYSVLLANFFLIRVRYAWMFAFTAVAFLFFMNQSFQSAAERWSFAVTSMVMCCFAATFAIRSELQRSMLHELATRDALTDVANRRSLDEEMQIAVAEYQRSDRCPGMLVMDLDHFKRVNDDCGHDIGDQVLKDFARLIERFTRSQDRLFRFGGEEFVLLVAQATPDGVERLAENLRQTIEQRLKYPGGKVTVSIGIALPLKGETPRDWLRRADKALFRAKDAGRNCWFVAE